MNPLHWLAQLGAHATWTGWTTLAAQAAHGATSGHQGYW